jgi:hypothetical protein
MPADPVAEAARLAVIPTAVRRSRFMSSAVHGSMQAPDTHK